MQDISGQHFGRPKLEIQRELNQARNPIASDDAFFSTDIGLSPGEANAPFWSH